jgi:hypothetical protein
MSVTRLYLIAAAAILGCSPTSGTSGTGASTAPRRANVLTAEEIVAAKADNSTSYDAVARLRPQWLTSHGPTSFVTEGTEFAIVFVDGHRYGDRNSLRNIPASDVEDIRYYNSAEAGGRFGLRAGTGGVIEVRMHLRIAPSPPEN